MWMVMWTLVLAGGVEFEARTTAGPVVHGPLVELSAEHVVLESAGQRLELFGKAGELVARPAPAAPSAKPAAWATLTDGSLVALRSFEANGGKARLLLASSGARAALSLGTVARVWFGEVPPSAADAADAKPGATDSLAVRSGGRIDRLSGTIGDVTSETVAFELDGQTIAVKRGKVLGLFYAPAAERKLPASIARVVDSSGSRWFVEQLAMSGDKARIKTPAGLEVELPLATVSTIVLSEATLLTALKPESVRVVPLFGPSKENAEAERALLAPRFDVGFDGLPLMVGGRSYASGLALHSRSEVVYRLDGKFRRFEALAAIDDIVRPLGDVKLQVFGDERLLWEGKLTGRDAKPTALSIELGGARRLKLVVDYDGDEVGDHLDLCDARVVE